MSGKVYNVRHYKDISWIHTRTQSVFSLLSHMRIYVIKVMIVCLIDRYQKVIPRAMLLYELKKVQERFMLMTFRFMTHDCIGHLKTHCKNHSSLSTGIECEWKHYSSPFSIEKNTRRLVWIQFYKPLKEQFWKTVPVIITKAIWQKGLTYLSIYCRGKKCVSTLR